MWFPHWNTTTLTRKKTTRKKAARKRHPSDPARPVERTSPSSAANHVWLRSRYGIHEPLVRKGGRSSGEHRNGRHPSAARTAEPRDSGSAKPEGAARDR